MKPIELNSMKHFFIENLRKYGQISENTEKLLLPHIKHCIKPKGSHLLKKGQVDGGLYILDEEYCAFIISTMTRKSQPGFAKRIW